MVQMIRGHCEVTYSEMNCSWTDRFNLLLSIFI